MKKTKAMKHEEEPLVSMRRRMKNKARKHEEEEEEEEETGDKDRLNNLPDHIIHHIFSFLDTQYSVQTCVLSKRWKSLWASALSLHFRFNSSFLNTRYSVQALSDHLQFQKFVGHVLSRREDNVPVTKLYLCDDYEFENIWMSLHERREEIKFFAERIIDYAASHSLQCLSISSVFALLAILSPLKNSHSLKTLHLSGFMEVSLLSIFDLPKLTTLHLNDCSFGWLVKGSISWMDSDPFARLINLKSLILVKFNCAYFSVLKISGPQLESLTIDNMYTSHPYGDDLTGFEVEIFAPKLKSFCFRRTNPLEFSNLDLPLLEIAEIDAHLPDSKDKGHKDKLENFQLNMINMLLGLYHAHSLQLSSNTIEVLMAVPGVLENQTSPFSRLKTLKLQCYSNSLNIPSKLMIYFLSGSTLVENIRIKYDRIYGIYLHKNGAWI